MGEMDVTMTWSFLATNKAYVWTGQEGSPYVLSCGRGYIPKEELRRAWKIDLKIVARFLLAHETPAKRG
jgi:hypothetical protein